MEEKIYNLQDKKIQKWFQAVKIEDVPNDGGVAVKYNDIQIAIFNFSDTGEWYATQNKCPHQSENALSRGIIGDTNGEPKVACPFHKKSFSLKSGQCLTGGDYQIDTYPVKVDKEFVYIGIS